MTRSKTTFLCQSCGSAHTRWAGRCEACGEWNSIVEELADSGVGAGPKSAVAGGRPVELVPLAGETESAARVPTGLDELDRVLGGGFVMGSAVLVGGDPGIGKSTLLLQAAAADGQAGQARRLRLGRRGGGADPASRPAARARRQRRAARQRDQCRDHPRDAAERPCPASRHHRFDPDALDRPGRERARAP